MPAQFYKPNKFNTGSACALSINSKGGAVYVEIVKQLSWDTTTENGSFYDREKKEKGENVKIQIDRDEIGGLIYAIQTKKEFKAFHESETQQTQITFGLLQKWNKDKKIYEGDPIGYSLVVNRNSKETAGEKSTFKIGFTFGEGMVLLEYFKFALEKIFSAIYAEDKKKAEDRAKAKSSE